MTTQTLAKPKTYTNPSWTMAIASRPSALSRWWRQSLSEISRFSLQLNVAKEDSDYEAPDRNVEDDHLAQGQPVVIQGTQSQLEGLAQLTEQYVQSYLGRGLTAAEAEPQINPDTALAFGNEVPEWQVDSEYSHRLSFGALQVEPILRYLKVTTTQLYDLAEILQQALADIQPLPSGTFARTLPERSPNWGKTAAVAAVAVAVTGGAAWFVGRNAGWQTASESQPEEQISLNRPQDAPSGNPQINLPPNFQIKPTEPPKSSSSPEEKTSKTTATAKQVTSPSAPETSVSATVDSVETAIAQQKSPQSAPTKDRKSGGGESAVSKPKPASNGSSQTASPASSTTSSSLTTARKPEAVKPKKTDDVSPKPPAPAASPAASIEAIAPSPLPSTSSQSEVPSSLAVPAPQAAAAPPSPNAANRSGGVTSDADLSMTSEVSRQAPINDSRTTLLRFFQAQWKGQDALAQNLVYTVAVKPDGTVVSVTPKTDLASRLLSQVPLPRPGETLMPPISNSTGVTFEVTLYPDGTVSVK